MINREIENVVKEREETIQEKNREVEEVLDEVGILYMKEKHSEITNDIERAKNLKGEIENKLYRALGIMMSENKEQILTSHLKLSSEGVIVTDKNEEEVDLKRVAEAEEIKKSLIDTCESEYKTFIHNIIDYISSFSDDLHSLFGHRQITLSKSNSQSSNSYNYNIIGDVIVFSSKYGYRIPIREDNAIHLDTYKNDDLQKLFSHEKDVRKLLNETHNIINDVIAKLEYVLEFIMQRLQNRMVAEEI